MGYSDLSLGDLGTLPDFGSGVSTVPDVNLGPTDLGQSGSIFTASSPDTSGGGGAGIDWMGLAAKYGPAVASWGVKQLSGGPSWSNIATGAGKLFGGGGGGMQSSPPPLDTSIPVIAPRKRMGYQIGRRYNVPGAIPAGGGPPGTLAYLGYHHKMNPLNPKALNRAIRRVERFEHFAKRVLRITSPHKHVAGVKRRHHKHHRRW